MRPILTALENGRSEYKTFPIGLLCLLGFYGRTLLFLLLKRRGWYLTLNSCLSLAPYLSLKNEPKH